LKKLRTLAGRKVRDLRRRLIKLGKAELYTPLFQGMARILSQQRGGKNKVYSLHEPTVSCIAKGKAHKKYALGSKVSVDSLSGSHVVAGITSFVGNPHDIKTLATALDAVARWTGRRYERVLVDKGYRGHGQVGGSAVMIPGKKAHASAYAIRRHKQCCKRRSAIEAIIDHLKSDHRMGRNYLKGSIGDSNNALLAGMGFNFMLLLREITGYFFVLPLGALGWLGLRRQEALTAAIVNTRRRVLKTRLLHFHLNDCFMLYRCPSFWGLVCVNSNHLKSQFLESAPLLNTKKQTGRVKLPAGNKSHPRSCNKRKKGPVHTSP
jgi:hypothetical protein